MYRQVQPGAVIVVLVVPLPSQMVYNSSESDKSLQRIFVVVQIFTQATSEAHNTRSKSCQTNKRNNQTNNVVEVAKEALCLCWL